MPFVVCLSTIGDTGSDPPVTSDWEESWRRDKAHLVLSGVTREEHFADVVGKLGKVVQGLSERFQSIEPVSGSTLNIAAEVVQQTSQEIIGVNAWQQALDLPERVKALAKVEATEKAQTLLRDLRPPLRTMTMMAPQLKKKPELIVQFPETARQFSEDQEKAGELFGELHRTLDELCQKILKS